MREIDQLELVKLCRRLVTKTNGRTKAITISASDRCVLYHCAESHVLTMVWGVWCWSIRYSPKSESGCGRGLATIFEPAVPPTHASVTLNPLTSGNADPVSATEG